MKITSSKLDIVSIENENLSYTNMRSFYKSGDGVGIQVDPVYEGKEKEILALCNNIANAVYELKDVLNTD